MCKKKISKTKVRQMEEQIRILRISVLIFFFYTSVLYNINFVVEHCNKAFRLACIYKMKEKRRKEEKKRKVRERVG
jgi:predicted membrane protein